MRIITFSRYDDHTLPLFKSLKILPFGEQYEYKVATLVFKSLQNALPYPFVDYFTPYISPRHADHLQPPVCSHKLCEFSVRVIWGQESGTELKRNWNVVKLLETLRDYTQLIYSTPSKSYPDLNTMIQVNSPKGFKRLFYLLFLFFPHRHHTVGTIHWNGNAAVNGNTFRFGDSVYNGWGLSPKHFCSFSYNDKNPQIEPPWIRQVGPQTHFFNAKTNHQIRRMLRGLTYLSTTVKHSIFSQILFRCISSHYCRFLTGQSFDICSWQLSTYFRLKFPPRGSLLHQKRGNLGPSRPIRALISGNAHSKGRGDISDYHNMT